MITLAIECATQTVGIAFLDQKKILAELYLDTGGGHAEVLLPALEKLFFLTGLTTERIDLLVCTTGPGSFTGVRIGVSTIKGLALATGKPIVGVSTLEALAMNVFPSRKLICPLLDARKNQVYAGLYRVGPDGYPEAVAPDRLTDIESLVKTLVAEEVDFVGEAAVLYQQQIFEGRARGSTLQTCRCCRLNASAVGLIGLHRYQHGRIEDPLTFSPRYLRLSEAENNSTK
ncbi:MAG: tRNA (adenosine(37)-N6)-threonylcarbamoyltransferase complex dimerization subunit type 1 TsaB [Deltaproteobacteria bacterium]|nr:tRNA (adenosine(37)-N6)-threonylcarbamoyltransferase complex dimerization subunit type 1 TsaB [Deltaproteobacteria bacterium]